MQIGKRRRNGWVSRLTSFSRGMNYHQQRAAQADSSHLLSTLNHMRNNKTLLWLSPSSNTLWPPPNQWCHISCQSTNTCCDIIKSLVEEVTCVLTHLDRCHLYVMIYTSLSTTILWAVCLCNSCAETQSCPTCDGASETRKSWRASETEACPSSPALPLSSCSRLGLWPTSSLSPALSRLQSSSPIPKPSPFPPPASAHAGSPTSSPPLSPSPACSLSLSRPLCVGLLPTSSPPCRSSLRGAPSLPHLQAVWRSGVCQGGRALVRPKCGGSRGTWCFLMESSRSLYRVDLRVLPVCGPSPLQRSASRSGCFVFAETGGAGRAAGPRPRWPSSLGPLCCC